MAEALHEEPLGIVPYPNAMTRWDHAEAARVTECLTQVTDDPEQSAFLLTRYTFNTHPDVLDLPPAVLHRFLEANRIMSRFQNGGGLLRDQILGHFQAAENRFAQGFSYTDTATVISLDPLRPAPVLDAGRLVQKVALPNQW